VYAKRGQYDEALRCIGEALRFDPKLAEAHYQRGTLLVDRGQVLSGLDALQKAVSLQPRSTAYANALAWELATRPGLARQDRLTAVQLARRVIEQSASQDPSVLDTLAAALAANGQFEEAIQTARMAVELAESQESMSLAARIRNRLQLYEAGKPYVQP
jgi:tetratricopeptide (TPR) repeat protein